MTHHENKETININNYQYVVNVLLHSAKSIITVRARAYSLTPVLLSDYADEFSDGS